MGKNKNELIIKVKVEPRSSKSGIAGPYGDGLKIRLTSPPIEGEANKELIEVLAKKFKIKKKDVEIISGKKSKNKIVRLKGVNNIEGRLKTLIKPCVYLPAVHSKRLI